MWVSHTWKDKMTLWYNKLQKKKLWKKKTNTFRQLNINLSIIATSMVYIERRFLGRDICINDLIQVRPFTILYWNVAYNKICCHSFPIHRDFRKSFFRTLLNILYPICHLQFLSARNTIIVIRLPFLCNRQATLSRTDVLQYVIRFPATSL